MVSGGPSVGGNEGLDGRLGVGVVMAGMDGMDSDRIGVSSMSGTVHADAGEDFGVRDEWTRYGLI